MLLSFYPTEDVFKPNHIASKLPHPPSILSHFPEARFFGTEI